MCYFVEINLSRQALKERFGIPVREDPRYMPAVFHSAFSQPYLPVITQKEKDVISMARWGLIPAWVKDEDSAGKISNSTYNARTESVWEKPSFRTAAKNKRCLVLASGFFEWHTLGKLKIPFYIRREDKDVIRFAGLRESWANPATGEILETCSILTLPANPLMARIHNSKKRMPAVLEDDAAEIWLSEIPEKRILSDAVMSATNARLSAHTINKQKISKGSDIHDPSITDPFTYPELNTLF